MIEDKFCSKCGGKNNLFPNGFNENTGKQLLKGRCMNKGCFYGENNLKDDQRENCNHIEGRGLLGFGNNECTKCGATIKDNGGIMD